MLPSSCCTRWSSLVNENKRFNTLNDAYCGTRKTGTGWLEEAEDALFWFWFCEGFELRFTSTSKTSLFYWFKNINKYIFENKIMDLN